MKEVTRFISDSGEMFETKGYALESDMWHKVRTRVETVFHNKVNKGNKDADLCDYFQNDIVYRIPQLLEALGIEWDEDAFMAREFTDEI